MVNETRWAQSVGVQSTPTIVVNGYVILGAQPLNIFEDIFQNYLGN